ncbi:MAG: preprotein translocase subunit SecE [Parcubacteria group bacterium CG10_big_fil_rev_8_21_14_0_10_38_31]|nr:MAG: preprotein translocase subunit SecE [Parcubacteria group bacterium CG10_big_fil_rev_8_21_14_0_10_38_31]
MKLTDYLRDTKGELKYVKWPSRKDTVRFTFIVIVVSIFVALYLGFFDFIFSYILDKFII